MARVVAERAAELHGLHGRHDLDAELGAEGAARVEEAAGRPVALAGHDAAYRGQAGAGGAVGQGVQEGDGVRVMRRSEKAVHRLPLDCVIAQSAEQHEREPERLGLTAEQRRAPRIYLEHDPPRAHPTDTRHPVDDPDVLLVHVTAFNALMWDAGRTPTRVIEHGVVVPDGVVYSGEIPRALAVVNNIARRGRRLGHDVLARVRARVPVDLVGMGARDAGGLGEVSHRDLPAFEARYRVFFNPIRYTSLGLAVCEAMMIGMPIVGLATIGSALLITGYAQEFGPVPPMRVAQIGYGAGNRDFADMPNVLRVLIGEADAAAASHTVVVLEAEIDDMNPQIFGVLMDRLLAQGALDVFYTPIQMKKNRPGTLLTVVAPPARRQQIAEVIFSETTTIGLRHHEVERECLEREIVSVETPLGAVRFKLAWRGGRVINAVPEYDDCVALATKHALPVKEVQAIALQAYGARRLEGSRLP